MKKTEKSIFSPLKLSHMELKNRLIRSATWEGIASIDGSIDDRIYEIYTELSKGGRNNNRIYFCFIF